MFILSNKLKSQSKSSNQETHSELQTKVADIGGVLGEMEYRWRYLYNNVLPVSSTQCMREVPIIVEIMRNFFPLFFCLRDIEETFCFQNIPQNLKSFFDNPPSGRWTNMVTCCDSHLCIPSHEISQCNCKLFARTNEVMHYSCHFLDFKPNPLNRKGVVLKHLKKYLWLENFISVTSRWYSPFYSCSRYILQIQNLFLYLFSCIQSFNLKINSSVNYFRKHLFMAAMFDFLPKHVETGLYFMRKCSS